MRPGSSVAGWRSFNASTLLPLVVRSQWYDVPPFTSVYAVLSWAVIRGAVADCDAHCRIIHSVEMLRDAALRR